MSYQPKHIDAQFPWRRFFSTMLIVLSSLLACLGLFG